MLEETRSAVEAILMVADQPVPTQLLAQITESSQDEIDLLVRDLAASYQQGGHGFVLIEIAGGWRYQSNPDLAGYVERFVLEGQTSRLSAAALETLAIIAYKQPISRAQVSAIRGVSVDGVVRTLEQRGYIGEVGRDAGPGQPVLFGTTALFLEKLGLASVGDLPPIADFVPGPDVVEALEHGLRVDAAAAVEEREEAASAPADSSSAQDVGSEGDDASNAAEAMASIDVDDSSAFEPSTTSVIDESSIDSD
jgi:segregation and condensation protein B